MTVLEDAGKNIPDSRIEIRELSKDTSRIKKTLYGENGDADKGLVTQFSLMKKDMETASEARKEMKEDIASIKKMAWAIILLILSLFIQQLWSIMLNPETVEQVIIVVTATPHP